MARDIDKAQALSLLQELRNLEYPSRKIDTDIALLLGFERFEGDKVVWLHPDTRRETRVPRFTATLTQAHDLARTLLPNHVAACTWGPEYSSARIEPGPQFEATNPAIALCLCALFGALSGHAQHLEEDEE
jgi:hypothetical protein